MNGWLASTRIRASAGAVLGALLVLAPAQAVLESREATETQAAFEGTHLSTCVRLHDHRFCVLSGRAPWAPATGVRTIALPRVDRVAHTPSEDELRASPGVRATQARSPPVRS